jgi:hypothetical protein
MGSKPSQAPTPYQPPNQAGAAANFQTGANQLQTQGQQLSSQVDPALSQISQNVASNPFFNQALTGAQNAANVATQQVAPQQLQGSSLDQQIAALGGAAAPATSFGGIMAANPTLFQGLINAATAYTQGQGAVGAAAGQGMTATNAANQVLNTGFDPQQALYDRSFQQMQDQTNAINSMYGLGGSPYGAGVASDAARNFNIDWQNAQLGRQLQALSGYSGATSAADANLQAALSGVASNYTNLASGAVGQYGALTSNAANNIASLGNLAVNAGAGASNLGTEALNTISGAAQLPQDVFLQQQQARLAAIGSQIQGTNAAAAQTQQGTSDWGQYLNIGQQASAGALNAWSAQQQANQSAMAGFGNLFGDVLGMFSFAL